MRREGDPGRGVEVPCTSPLQHTGREPPLYLCPTAQEEPSPPLLSELADPQLASTNTAEDQHS
eukprot:1186652-Prorocentrum_minimum.AAC.3